MTTDTTEMGLESLIVAAFINEAGYVEGSPNDYDRDHAVDLVKLLFIFGGNPNPYRLQILALKISGVIPDCVHKRFESATVGDSSNDLRNIRRVSSCLGFKH